MDACSNWCFESSLLLLCSDHRSCAFVCASLSAAPNGSNAWWTAPLPSRELVLAVSITSQGDCCWSDIGTAQIYIGNSPWLGPGSASQVGEAVTGI
jgi:hypothetical protein